MWTICFVRGSAAKRGIGPDQAPRLDCSYSENAGGAPCMRNDPRTRLPRHRYRMPNLASQSRTAFSSMAWNTGSSSPGELEMTRSTSEVAVCCSKRLRSSCSLRLGEFAGPLVVVFLRRVFMATPPVAAPA